MWLPMRYFEEETHRVGLLQIQQHSGEIACRCLVVLWTLDRCVNFNAPATGYFPQLFGSCEGTLAVITRLPFEVPVCGQWRHTMRLLHRVTGLQDINTCNARTDCRMTLLMSKHIEYLPIRWYNVGLLKSTGVRLNYTCVHLYVLTHCSRSGPG